MRQGKHQRQEVEDKANSKKRKKDESRELHSMPPPVTEIRVAPVIPAANMSSPSVLFTSSRPESRLALEQHLGEGCSGERPTTL